MDQETQDKDDKFVNIGSRIVVFLVFVVVFVELWIIGLFVVRLFGS